ncbi:MAG: 30S ribosomal protein S12 methylthiotransferase RimO [Bacteroidota bacterium]|nr:30S ribosomal protein S12 methylthiotransferase RimO [Bacteroidota bacterium]MDP4232834.1 30S ribosomal protein S12 methylthiotransferase RimO [Bacteroidota bacterium]MDP4241878.1 30S ribosomal protein S12 methylthiotransferase RimO [Bacteroidota bacterium]MDP4288203.1 30S ribosomal protein S12 methylthiotransferase RimO [Bacteroidota bacterium]
MKPLTPAGTVSVVTLGCEKNTVDSEVLMGKLRRRGLRLVADPEQAETIIVNTCGFIDHAKKESIDAILEATELKRGAAKDGRTTRVLVAGCLSERYRSELETEISEVDGYFGTQDFENILSSFGPEEALSLGFDPKLDLISERVLTTPKHFAYMKISEGCDHPCSFCAIPIMRGGHRSRSIEELEFEAMMLASNGLKELVLIAQDSTYYGLDNYGSRTLAKLLERLCRVNGIEWIRLMYAYPAQFPLDVLDVMAGEEKIVKYLDMPVQHASTNVLKHMRRGITRRATEELVAQIRNRIPGIALRTTLITGFPTESDQEFEELEQFVGEMQFDRLGVFTYSQEEGTSAHPLGDPIPQAEKFRRQRRLYELQEEVAQEKRLTRIGSMERALIERAEGEFYFGRTRYDAPEVDEHVRILASGNDTIAVGTFADIQITSAADSDAEYELESVLL